MSQLVLRRPAVPLETEQPTGWVAINALPLSWITKALYGRLWGAPRRIHQASARDAAGFRVSNPTGRNPSY